MTLSQLAPPDCASIIPPELDPRLVAYTKSQIKRLRQLNGSQRAALLFERYPDLRQMPLVDWERVDYWQAYSVLCGAASGHFARLYLAAIHGILIWTGATPHYFRTTDTSLRHLLNRLQMDFGIATPLELTFDLCRCGRVRLLASFSR